MTADEARPGRVELHAADGRRYVVYDVVEHEPHKGRRTSLADPAATHRVFQPPTGARLAYRFKDGETHHPDIELLLEQLRCAGFIGAHLYIAPSDPR